MKETNISMEFLDELDPELMKRPSVARGGRWIDDFRTFLQSNEAQNAVITFPNEKERRNCKSALVSFKKRYNYDLSYGNYGPGIKMWISKPKTK